MTDEELAVLFPIILSSYIMAQAIENIAHYNETHDMNSMQSH